MSAKSAEHVARYVTQVSEIQSALADLHRWASNLPIPTSGMELETLHYGHVGTVGRIHAVLSEAASSATANRVFMSSLSGRPLRGWCRRARR